MENYSKTFIKLHIFLLFIHLLKFKMYIVYKSEMFIELISY